MAALQVLFTGAIEFEFAEALADGSSGLLPVIFCSGEDTAFRDGLLLRLKP